MNALEHILTKKKKRAILFLDEFQEIARIKSNHAIEGAIRHFAQSSKHVVFIFSGSNRHMLAHMFSDKTHPLYALCDEIRLDKLSPDDYSPYLNKIARKTWGTPLSDKAFDAIMQVTEHHPRYVYNLCTFLWDHCMPLKKTPGQQQVNQAWSTLIYDKLKDTRELLSTRAAGQIKLLSLIALGHDKEMSGQSAQTKLGVSGSAISQSLKLLEKDDYIEKRENEKTRKRENEKTRKRISSHSRPPVKRNSHFLWRRLFYMILKKLSHLELGCADRRNGE